MTLEDEDSNDAFDLICKARRSGSKYKNKSELKKSRASLHSNLARNDSDCM